MTAEFIDRRGERVFRLHATYSTRDGQPQSVRASAIVDSEQIARDMAAQFAKSTKVRATGINGVDDYYKQRDEQGNLIERGLVSFTADLLKNGVNGGVNETGLRRMRSFIAAAALAGYEIEYVAAYSNSYASFDAFLDAIAPVAS